MSAEGRFWHIAPVRCSALARPLAGVERTLSGARATDANVTGFGCRPMTSPSTRTEGRRPKAAREGRRGKWGTRLSGRYGDLAGRCGAASTDRCGRGGGRQAATGRWRPRSVP